MTDGVDKELLSALPQWLQTVVMLVIAAGVITYFFRDVMEKFNKPVKDSQRSIKALEEQVLPKGESDETVRDIIEKLEHKLDSEIEHLETQIEMERKRSYRDERRQERLEGEQIRLRESIDMIKDNLESVKQAVFALKLDQKDS